MELNGLGVGQAEASPGRWAMAPQLTGRSSYVQQKAAAAAHVVEACDSCSNQLRGQDAVCSATLSHRTQRAAQKFC